MITIKNLKKNYRVQKVLDIADLTIPVGSIFALLGPNGSGKTTILKTLLGIVFPSPGSTLIVEDKKKTGYMPQFPKFPPHLTVKELISFFEKIRSAKAPHKEKLIGDLKIDSFWNKHFYELSGGMIQKINILQCFMFDFSFFILDEPTSGLDPHSTFYLKRLIREKKNEGRTVLLTSHVMSEVEELADHMALLVEGKIYTVTSPDALKKEKKSATLEEALYQFWNGATADEKN